MQALPRDILDHPAIWRGGQYAKVVLESIPTGHAALDAQLPGAGWPRGALTEILADRPGIGEFSLLTPALAQLSRKDGWIALVAPPHIPYAPALAGHGIDLTKLILIHPGREQENLWAAERCLRARSCSAMIYWAAGRAAEHTLCRRLQSAAETSGNWAVVFRAAHWAAHTSPAALRLKLDAEQSALRVRLLKRRGGGGQPEITLETARVPGIPAPASVARRNLPPPLPATIPTSPGSRPPVPATQTDRWRRQVA